MDSNTHSTGGPKRLGALAAELQELAAQDPDRLSDATLAERVRVLRQLAERLEGHWLGELADLDARGAAGAEEGVQAGSTAAWLRHRLHMSPSTAAGCVRTARALFRGPLTATGQALTEGAISPAHAQVLAHDTQDLPDHVAAEAEPVLLEAARRLDPPRLRRVIAHLRGVADPEGADAQAERRYQQRGLWLSPTWEGMVALNGLLDPEAGQTLLAALEPLARPTTAARHPQRWPAPGRCPHRAGPPHPRGRPAAPERWGPAPAAGHRGPGQPPRPRWAGWGGRRALAAGPRDLPAAGLRRGRDQGAGHPPPDPPPRRLRRRGRPGGLAPGGGDPAPPDPWRRPHPTTGGRPDQPGRHRRPTRRPGRPRRRLCGGRLRPAPGLVRSPPSPPLAAWRPHRPRRTWPCCAEPIIARSMRAAGGSPATPMAG